MYDYNDIIDKSKGVLTVDHLQEDKDERKKARFAVYERVLKQCNVRILNKHRSNMEECEYEIPFLVPGAALINANGCMAYMIIKLKERGFYVERIENSQTLYINWNKKFKTAVKDGLYKKIESPKKSYLPALSVDTDYFNKDSALNRLKQKTRMIERNNRY